MNKSNFKLHFLIFMRKVVSFLSLNFHVFPSLRHNRNKSFMNGQKE